jgi:hypothetical protein
MSRTFAQQHLSYSFRHISEQDGLMHNHVLSVAQDSKVFIWIQLLKGCTPRTDPGLPIAGLPTIEYL